MNFQTVRNNPGKFIQMQATAIKFDIKTGEYGNYALGNIIDTTGENQKVFFAASDDSPLPDVSCKQQLAVWATRFDANTQKYKVYFNGFVQQQPTGAQPAQVPQTASQGSPQMPQAPPQATNAPQGTDTDARSIAINIASKLVTTGQHTPAELYGLADCIVDYIQYGKHPFGPAGAVPGTMDGSQMDQDFPNEPGSH